jgi:hypothetical protein
MISPFHDGLEGELTAAEYRSSSGRTEKQAEAVEELWIIAVFFYRAYLERVCALSGEPKQGVDAFLARSCFCHGACPNECVDQLRRFTRLGQADMAIGNRGQDCGHRGGGIRCGAQRR